MKTILLVTLFAFTMVRGQYTENFENGVPGTMIQSFSKGQTSWINFGLHALYVDKAISDKNSAVFYDGIAITEVNTALQTPVLDLSMQQVALSFKYQQKNRTENYANILLIELSVDSGKSWQNIQSLVEKSNEPTEITIDLTNYELSTTTIIKFKGQQFNPTAGFPIIIDDINIKPIVKENHENALQFEQEVATVYPNPSNGVFNLTTKSPCKITVFDKSNKIIYDATTETNSNEINLTSFGKGLFIMQIDYENSAETKKLIIQ